jgi:hypothetical protein
MRETITREWIEGRLDTLFPTHVEALVRLLVDLRRLFDGDLDAVLVLAATSVSIRAEGWRDALFEGKPLDGESNPTNTQSLAHLTGIPRETVRRKLTWLESKGWVRRDDLGNWKPSASTTQQLRPGTLATITYLRAILNAGLRAEMDGALPRPA